jgi:oligopeptide transport system permease protein
MLRLIASRLLQLPLILAAVLLLTFTLAWLAPGNPLDRPEGRRPAPEVIAAMRAQYNLETPWQFLSTYVDNATGLRWLRERLTGQAATREEQALASGHPVPPRPIFDLGPSLQYRDRRVSEIIADSLPVSVTLGAAAILLALIIGVAAGVIGAVKPNSPVDAFTLALALVGISLPSFVIGTGLQLMFSVWIPLLPVGRWGSPSAAILPVITLSLPFAAYIARLTRMGMIDVLSADFIRTARAKGAPESRIILRHALRNAILPVISYLGPATAFAMTGSFVVERVFSIPGLGQHFVNAVLNKDLFLILGVVMVFATMLILFNLVVDVLYRWVDPRIA